MERAQISYSPPRKIRRRRDFGRTLARLLCVLFAMVGAIPLTGGLVLRSEPLQRWGASETSRLLREQLGVEATFQVELSLIPLRLAVKDLTVPASDGGSPAVSTRLVAVSPRFFSLLAGRIDVGDIELEDSSVRLVLRDGKVQNVAYRFPQTKGGEPPKLERAPFRSLAVTNARFELDVDGTQVTTEGIEIDAFAEPDLAFDIAVRIDGATARSQHDYSYEDHWTETMVEGTSINEDRICALELRTHVSKEKIVVRRFSLLGGVDVDPAEGTRPDCSNLKESEKLAVRLSQIKVEFQPEGPPTVRGHVMARGPTPVINRYLKIPPLEGWAGFSGEIAYDGQTKLPEVQGQVSGAGLKFERYAIAEELHGEILITGDVIQAPELMAKYANGTTWLKGVRVAPFAESIPLEIATMKSEGVNFPGLMRDLGIAKHTIVEWNFGNTLASNIKGTGKPFALDGRIVAHTRDFAVNDSAWHDPNRKQMISLSAATVDGHFRADPEALHFYDTDTRFGNSSLPIDIVSIGFHNSLVVRLKEDVKLDLADVSPIAGVELAGKSTLNVNMEGPGSHPILEGSIAVEDMMIGGFEVGDLEETKIHFEPLFVDLFDAKGKKGDMTFTLPQARLAFGNSAASGASVEFTAEVDSDNFVIREFFDIFDFDDDPRFEDISGKGSARATLHYMLGGPADTCEGGRLIVDGSTRLDALSLLGEDYTGADGEFYFEWFDMEASTRGFRLDIPSLALRKGSGTVFGSGSVEPGGMISGEFVATRVPISRVDALGDLVDQADGFVTGTGRLSGRLEAMGFTANVGVSEVRAGKATLPPSQLAIRLEPIEPQQRGPLETTACGRPIPSAFDQDLYDRDESEGTFYIEGELFDGQVKLDEMTISSQRSKVVRARARIDKLNLGSLSAFMGAGALSESLPQGSLSGTVDLEEYFLDRPFDSRGRFAFTEAHMKSQGFMVGLADERAALVLGDGKLRTEYLALGARTPGGQHGILDASVELDGAENLLADLKLREANLGVLAPALPGIERADGRLLAGVHLEGKMSSPKISGSIEVHEGELQLSGVSTPVTNVELVVGVDHTGLSVKQGEANWGGGLVTLRGTAPLNAGRLGLTDLQLTTRDVVLPFGSDARVNFDSDLRLAVPASGERDAPLPRLTGTVDIRAASYERPMNVTADLASLTSRARKSQVEAYSPDKDALEIDVLVRSSKPLVIKNELVEGEVALDPTGLRISGTNQRYGAVGNVEIPAGGRIYLRGHEFEITSGLVRFDDPTQLRPEVDLTAVTEYRRYQDRDPTSTSSASSTTSTTTTTTGRGNWRISMHAYGPPEDLKVDMTSDPPLADDDIFLLLTVGLTRTELDQSQQAGVGSSVALEALGSLSGAESAVTETVPIDEFRFGSTYSARSGRTEPTVTIGKRLSDRIRASVTTTMSDSNEVRSNVEYRATDNLSVEGSYDNAQSSGSAAVGNLGGDVRWRLEFE